MASPLSKKWAIYTKHSLGEKQYTAFRVFAAAFPPDFELEFP
jgi:hypothetical protein